MREHLSANPFAALRPALEFIVKEAKVLPATGQAKEMRRVSRAGARIALVVGNAQYYGVPVLVDELTADVGKQVGLTCEGLLVVRNRGNSAQQMGRFGRRPSRESVVLFCNPVCSPYLNMKDARDLRFVPLLTSAGFLKN